MASRPQINISVIRATQKEGKPKGSAIKTSARTRPQINLDRKSSIPVIFHALPKRPVGLMASTMAMGANRVK